MHDHHVLNKQPSSSSPPFETPSLPFKMSSLINLLAAVLTLAVLPRSTAQIIVPGSAPSGAVAHDVTPTPPPSSSQTTIRVLVCGDSISQGSEGDYTWRYRLWEWFRSSSLEHATSHPAPALEYVGPYNGTLPAAVLDDNDPYHPTTWGAYAPDVDPLFSPGGGSSHFAVYGKPAWQVVDLLQDQVAAYQPDVVVLHLGFNDFGWWDQKATDLIEVMKKLVFASRLARRDVKVFIADVSHRLLVLSREDIPVTTDKYNAMLADKAVDWSTPESPVYAVKVSEDYECRSACLCLMVLPWSSVRG